MGQNHFTGKAGQLAVMSEIALRGYNVAIPEVDIGDDIFVVNDATGAMNRLQVKTSLGITKQIAHRCQFSIRVDQISTDIYPDVDYVFVTRLKNSWEFLIIPRQVIKHFMQSEKIGTKSPRNNDRKDYLKLWIVFHQDGKILLGSKDVTEYKNNWNKWKPLNPITVT